MTLGQDLRYAFRTLRKSPGFTAFAVLCLALGIGANTAIFSLIDAALLRMLPVFQPERLVAVHSVDEEGRERMGFSYPQYTYLSAHTRELSGILAYAGIGLNLSAGELTDAPAGQLVSGNFFSVLGVQASLGRMLQPGDEAVAVLSHRYWQSRFHGDAGIVGRPVRLNGLAFTIAGVTPPRFFGVEVGSSPDVFVPVTMCDRLSPGLPRLPRPNNFWLNLMGRLQPGAPLRESRAHAIAETEILYRQGLAEQAPGLRPSTLAMLQKRRIGLNSGDKGMGGMGRQFGGPLLTLMSVAALVLLIACANVANLLLARASARRREIAVRLALGAGRARLLRQFLTESLVLSVAGGALGVLFAWWSSQALVSFLTGRVLQVSPDARVLGFALAVSILTGLIFGAAPALQSAHPDLTPALKYEAAAGTSGRRIRLGGLLVVGQVAMSMLLLIGAGLFIRTLGNLKNLDAGFHADRVLLVSLNPGLSRYTAERTRSFYEELLERVSSLPGVRSASVADAPLLSGSYVEGLSVEGYPMRPDETPDVSMRVAGPRFFETMGIALRLGRDFTPADRAGAPKVAIINETIARRCFGGQSPIGKHVGLGPVQDMEVVGVIADTKYRNLREPVPNTLYAPIDQFPAGSARTLHVRSAADPGPLGAAIREQIRAIDRNLPVKIGAFSELVDANLVQERLIATLCGFFGGLALLLASIGLYGVMAYHVQRRTREIGIRMSLGAGCGGVLWMVLRSCLLMAVAGVAIGAPASVWLSKLVAHQLFGVAPGDPATLAVAAATMTAVAALAGYLPARRASLVDPMIALRYE